MWGGGFKSGYEGLYLSVHILLHNLLDFVGLDNAKIKAAVRATPEEAALIRNTSLEEDYLKRERIYENYRDQLTYEFM